MLELKMEETIFLIKTLFTLTFVFGMISGVILCWYILGDTDK